MECGALAGIALDPYFSAHQFGQTFADRQAEAGAPVMTRGGGINLLEGFEEAVLPIERNADAGVAHREMEEPLLRMTEKVGIMFAPRLHAAGAAAGGGHFDDDFALVGELDRVANEVDQNL